MKKSLFILAHIILSLLIAIQVWRIADLLLFTGTEEAAIPEIQRNVAVPESAPKRDIETLVSIHLFGQEQITKQELPKVRAESAPVSTKSYRIASLAYSDQAPNASVVLEVRPGDMEFYKISDEIESGVLLDSIFSNGILLNNAGRAERVEYVRVRQPALVRVKNSKTTGAVDRNEPADWSWIQNWESMETIEVLKKLDLHKQGNLFVIGSMSPLLSNWNFAGGDRVLAINGAPLRDDGTVRSVLAPLRVTGVVHVLIENDRRRNLVRWERQM